jgi:hypothetical protein
MAMGWFLYMTTMDSYCMVIFGATYASTGISHQIPGDNNHNNAGAAPGNEPLLHGASTPAKAPPSQTVYVQQLHPPNMQSGSSRCQKFGNNNWQHGLPAVQ